MIPSLPLDHRIRHVTIVTDGRIAAWTAVRYVAHKTDPPDLNYKGTGNYQDRRQGFPNDGLANVIISCLLGRALLSGAPVAPLLEIS